MPNRVSKPKHKQRPAESVAAPLHRLSDDQLVHRLDLVEKLIGGAKDPELPTLNRIFQKLLEEQVRRDLLAEDRQREV